MYDHLLHHERKHFCCYCVHAFIKKKILKLHIKDCFKINSKQTIQIELPFMVYADFESILVPEDNVKQNQNDSYTCKYQKHVACNYG